jgi:hypothetical protein
MKYTIHYVKPFYHLCERRKWWIFGYWKTINISINLEEMEKEYERLSKK